MNIQSTFSGDIRSAKSAPGAYEWWYFDAVSEDGDIEIVVIFYDGNPFSRRYIQHQRNGTKAAAEDFPAVSISVYKNHQPLYYSFTEVDKSKALFGEDNPSLKIAGHTMEGRNANGKITYDLSLKEKLPSGDAIVGQFTFESPKTATDLFEESRNSSKNHRWNLVQPQAGVSGTLKVFARNEPSVTLNFKGSGYHDHNVGDEPLKHQFTDWYWGRFHFERTILVYYVMDKQQSQFGWLISRDSREIIDTFDDVKMEDYGRTLYGLTSARKLTLSNDKANVMVQQAHQLDNGPFYQRFSSDAFLNMHELNTMQSSRGITEYLCPPRIYKRLFWPLTNMRIRYQKESPHWVQRSKTLYRWTW
jgi:carotenoid 1,2-hydratase